MIKPLNEKSSVKKVIGVVSGKGGVGKSLVTAMLAVNMANRGHHAAILDADITGPSIPKAFGIEGRVEADEDGIIPARTVKGIDIMSTNLILENDSDPVVWRGPVIAGAVEQFWTECHWDNVDYMFVDMPPGTGDVPLTVFQSLPVDGIIIVTSPQDLVTMIVGKAVKMAQLMNIPILGLVENMSYFKCPDCGNELTMGAVGMDIAFHSMIGNKRDLRLIDFLFSLAGTRGYGNDTHDILHPRGTRLFFG